MKILLKVMTLTENKGVFVMEYKGLVRYPIGSVVDIRVKSPAGDIIINEATIIDEHISDIYFGVIVRVSFLNDRQFVREKSFNTSWITKVHTRGTNYKRHNCFDNVPHPMDGTYTMYYRQGRGYWSALSINRLIGAVLKKSKAEHITSLRESEETWRMYCKAGRPGYIGRTSRFESGPKFMTVRIKPFTKWVMKNARVLCYTRKEQYRIDEAINTD